MEAVAASESRVREVKRPDGVGRRADYFGEPGAIDTNPQAFLVELPYAGATVKPHFHDIDQFQVIVAGHGRIGKKPLQVVTFQYADGYTPYGPIVANDDGISFFTLRNVASGGHFTMPGSKHLMACRAGRNIAGTFNPDLSQATGASVEPLMPPQDDGVGAFGVTLGANQAVEGPASDGGGQYCLVTDGAVLHDGQEMPRNSLWRVEAGEPAPVFQASADGAAVLILQFSRPSDRPGCDPATLAARDPGGYVQKTVR